MNCDAQESVAIAMISTHGWIILDLRALRTEVGSLFNAVRNRRDSIVHDPPWELASSVGKRYRSGT